ncbi:hypothetical protein BJ875DRAFT_476975 [Amylocarpus encephaloides]|uniref:Uncharacterized protein n=1 Tax=Amylocarpus encephaloides TaxID=45428 RepID=A0A9P7Y7Q9_9HELO|nr:hypothetical protein BJ875DRAFT_476975 [Amylocarpus encephaloides]
MSFANTTEPKKSIGLINWISSKLDISTLQSNLTNALLDGTVSPTILHALTALFQTLNDISSSPLNVEHFQGREGDISVLRWLLLTFGGDKLWLDFTAMVDNHVIKRVSDVVSKNNASTAKHLVDWLDFYWNMLEEHAYLSRIGGPLQMNEDPEVRISSGDVHSDEWILAKKEFHMRLRDAILLGISVTHKKSTRIREMATEFPNAVYVFRESVATNGLVSREQYLGIISRGREILRRLSSMNKALPENKRKRPATSNSRPRKPLVSQQVPPIHPEPAPHHPQRTHLDNKMAPEVSNNMGSEASTQGRLLDTHF